MSSTFLFGKLPAHGDFVSRGLAAAERDGIDDWLSAELASSREELGGAFEDRFDSAPPWRFAWLDEAGWTAGATAPSMDSVGRRFPILVARKGLSSEDAPAAAGMCEDAIYAALSDGWDADRLVRESERPLSSDPDEGVSRDCWWTLGGIDFDEARLEGRRPRNLMLTMLNKSEAAA